MAFKFIITDQGLIIGEVVYHYDLVKKHNVTGQIKGGGYYEIDHSNKVVLLYGQSSDYGRPSHSTVQQVVEEGKVPEQYKEYEFYHSLFTDIIHARQQLANSKNGKIKCGTIKK